MFTDLTAAELGMLRSKLYSGGHKAAEVARHLGQQALQLPVLSTEHEVLWARRAPYAALMAESYELAELTETTRAAR